MSISKEWCKESKESVAANTASKVPDITNNIRKQMLEDIFRNALSDKNALDEVMNHVNKRNGKDLGLTKKDIYQVLNVAQNFEDDTSIWFILQVGLETGMSLSEIANLTVDDVVINENSISLCTISKKGIKKTRILSNDLSVLILTIVKWKIMFNPTKKNIFLFTWGNKKYSITTLNQHLSIVFERYKILTGKKVNYSDLKGFNYKNKKRRTMKGGSYAYTKQL